MTNKKFTIYSSISPNIEKIVSASERKKYLCCKFWKASKKEADLFYCLYFLPVYYGFPGNIASILSGELFKTNEIGNTFDRIKELETIYRDNPTDERLLTASKYKNILETIITDNNISYPRYGLIDDVIDWAQLKKITTPKNAILAKNKLSETRSSILTNGNAAETNFVVELIELLLKKHSFIYYDDAQALLFPDKELIFELKEAVTSGKIQAFSSLNGEYYYFHTNELIKWLMQNNHLSQALTNEFFALKVESIKENIFTYEGTFNSLDKLTQQGLDRNTLLAEALKGSSLVYLKYSRNLLRWRQYLSSTQNQSLSCDLYAIQRYDGLGQLKRYKTDDSFQCQFGGLTIDMLLYKEFPEHHLHKEKPSIACEIELVPTQEEFEHGLQPYIKISSHNLRTSITDNDIMIMTENSTLNKKSSKDQTPDIIPSEIIEPLPLETPPNKNKNLAFIKQDKIYQINYQGLTIHLPVNKGLEQIHFLLKNIHKSVSSIQLMQIVNKAYTNPEATLENFDELDEQGIVEDVFFSCGNDQVIDDVARNSYQKRLTKIAELIDESMALGDTDKVEELKNEEDDIIKHLSQDSNYKNQSRSFKNPAAKAREAVNKNITRALNKIANIHPLLHQHLKISIRIGGSCCYSPKNISD